MGVPVKRNAATVLAELPQSFAWLLFLFYAAVLLWHKQLPALGDLTNWSYSGALFARHLQGTADPWHALKHYPVPNSLLTVAIGLLCALLPFVWAVKAMLILYFLLCLAAVKRLAAVAQTSSLIWCIAPSGFFLAINFWYGFLAFQIGIALLFFFTAELVEALRNNGPASKVRLSVLLLLLFLTHAVPFTFACMLLFFFALQTRAVRLLWLLALPGLLVVLYGVGRVGGGNVDATALPPVETLNALQAIAYKGNTFLKSFGLVNPSTITRHSLALERFGAVGFLALVAVSVVVCTAMLLLFRRAAGSRNLGQYPFIALASGIALVGYLCMPQMLLGISDPGSRILQTVLWLAVFFGAGQGSQSRALRVAAVGSVVLALAGAALFFTIPWHAWPAGRQELPAAVEGLAKAPSGYAAQYTDDVLQGKWNDEVFPTGLLLNHGAEPLKEPLPYAEKPAP